ncbi:MAG TPA: tetratricopeptide repeat protein, partial [Kofleriaceae bacterium]|nr:tetratricopeptide repeat protein [Kofleriaceae bacterium]
SARGWVRLVSLVGFRKAEYVRGLSLVPRATAALARLGGNADIESRLERALGQIDTSKNKIDDGIAHHEKAVKLRERAFGDSDHYLAIILEGLGIAVLNAGHAARAVQIQLRAHTILEHLLGPSHPDSAHALTLLANARTAAGQPAVAEREIRQALAIEEVTLGAEHDDVGASLAYLAAALDAQGKIDEAIDAQRKAIAIGEGVLGREHPLIGERRVDLATLLTRRGRYPEARDQLHRAEAMFTSVLGPDHADLLFVSVGYGDLAVHQGRWRDAVAFYQRAMPILDSEQITRKDLAEAVINLERASLELHEPARGLALLERVASRLDEVRPELRVAVELTLARALWDARGDHRRAHALAAHALAEVQAIGDARRDDVSQIERWLTNHRVAD